MTQPPGKEDAAQGSAAMSSVTTSGRSGAGSASGLWHDRGMGRTRLSTTVDADLLESARRASGKPDSALVDDALAALLARHRAAEVDASYAAYDAHPLDEPDEWGDLASFRRAVAAS